MSVDDWPIGQTIVKVRLMTDEETAKEGWGAESATRMAATVALDLSDGTVLYASRDPEGNGPGELFGVDPDGALVAVRPGEPAPASTCRHCGEPISADSEGVYVDGTGGDVCCADEFTETNQNGSHHP